LSYNFLPHYLSISTIKNFPYAGSFTGFQISVQGGSSFSNFAITYAEDSFTASSISKSDSRAAIPNTHTINVTTKTIIPSSGVILIVAPSQVSYAGSSINSDTKVYINNTLVMGTLVS